MEDLDLEIKQGWTIQKVPDLEWALMRLANLESQIAEINAAEEEAHRRIAARATGLKDRIRRGIVFFSAHVQEFASRSRDALLGGSNKKSRTFLYGTVGWRKRPGKVVVQDREALVKWLQQQPDTDLFRITIEPEMKALQELCKRTGEIPPGCTYEEEHEQFYVDPVDPAGPGLVKQESENE